MGMDVYGKNPQQNADINKFKVYAKYSKMDFNEKWEHLDADRTKREKYWKEEDQYQRANPGVYFRNNVWWWRPLWNYVCTICDDILDEEDHDNGHSNSGHQINEKKAIAIAERINLFIENGDAEDYAKERQIALSAEGINASYGFDVDNLKEFGKFCEQSGGFEIC